MMTNDISTKTQENPQAIDSLTKNQHNSAPRHDADDLKSRVDLRALVRRFWGEPVRSRGSYDVHYAHWREDGRKPAFTVYVTGYKDYGGSGDSGDVFTFLQNELNLTFIEALNWLADDLNIDSQITAVRPRRRPTSPQQTAGPSSPPAENWQNAAKKALHAAQQRLWSSDSEAVRVRAYLRDIRGFTDMTIRRAGYGYNPHWQPVDWRHPETGKTAYLAPGIIEPWFADGHLWALRVRCRVGNLADYLNIPPDTGYDGDELPKYLNLAGSKQSGALYKGDSITPDQDVLIVEGGFDAQLAQQHLPDAAVVTLGSATNTPDPARIAQIQAGRRVFLLLDADAAGQDAQSRLQTALGDHAHALTLPQGKDVTDYVVKHGGNLGRFWRRETSAVWWVDGVPDGVRSALLTYFKPTIAPVIELVNRAAIGYYIEPEHFTLAELLVANDMLGFGLPESSLRRAVAEGVGLFFSKVEAKNPTEKVVSNADKNPGRPEQYFALKPRADVEAAILSWAAPRLYEKHHAVKFDEITGAITGGTVALPVSGMLAAVDDAPSAIEAWRSALVDVFEGQDNAHIKASAKARRDWDALKRDLADPHSTPLPPIEDWPLNNAAAYRAAYLRATNDPQQRRSRRAICRLLGIANGSVDRYLERAGLVPVNPGGEYETRPIEPGISLVGQVRQTAYALSGFPRTLVIRHEDGVTYEHVYEGTESQALVQDAFTAGAHVEVRYQVANRYLAAQKKSVPPLQKSEQKADDNPPPAPVPESPEKPPTDAAQTALTPTRTSTTVKRRKRPKSTHYGPTYNPAWVRDQLILSLLVIGRLEYTAPRPETGLCTLVDRLTGELLPDPSPRDLLARLLQSPCSNDPDRKSRDGPLNVNGRPSGRPIHVRERNE